MTVVCSEAVKYVCRRSLALLKSALLYAFLMIGSSSSLIAGGMAAI